MKRKSGVTHYQRPESMAWMHMCQGHRRAAPVRRAGQSRRFKTTSEDVYCTRYLLDDQQRLIVPHPGLMTGEELDWLDLYHTRCREEVLPLLTSDEDGPVREWLVRSTRPLREQAAA